MDFSNLNKQRVLILVASVIGLISVFLPWASLSTDFMGGGMGDLGIGISWNGFSSFFGIAAFFCFGVCIVISLLGNKTELLDKKNWFIVIACGAAAFLLTVIAMVNKPGIEHPLMKIQPGIGMGAWVSLVTSAGIVISAWLFKNPADSIEDSFNTLKNGLTSNTNSSAPVRNNSGEKNVMEEIEKLFQMKEKGIITEEDFKTMKQQLMSSN